MFRSKSLIVLYLSALLFLSSPVVGQEEGGGVDTNSLLRKAGAALSSEDFETAAKHLKAFTDAKKDDGQAWFLYGYALHMSGKIDEAIEVHKKATEFDEFKPTALYNLGCAYSIKDDVDQSIAYLNKSLDAGFKQLDTFESDEDLANVKKSDKYKQIQARIDNGGDRVEAKKQEKGKKNPLVGKWKVTSGTRQGNEVGAERLPPEITVTAKTFTIPAGEQAFVMSYKVVSKDDKITKLDFKIEEGPAPDGSALAILKVEGNKAMLCYDPTGVKRPEKFETNAENGCFMFTMEKIVPEFDASKVLGEWNVISGVRDGAEVAEERLEGTITFDKEKITIPAGEDEFVMSYKIDSKARPVQIDMEILSGPAPEGSKAVGIIRFKNGKFQLCYNAMGAERPMRFKSVEGDGLFLFTMEPNNE